MKALALVSAMPLVQIVDVTMFVPENVPKHAREDVLVVKQIVVLCVVIAMDLALALAIPLAEELA